MSDDTVYDYKNEHYDRVENKTHEQLKKELRDIFTRYPEYQDFDAMVKLFAADDFFKAHYTAREYLKGTGEQDQFRR